LNHTGYRPIHLTSERLPSWWGSFYFIQYMMWKVKEANDAGIQDVIH
jgi:hypothetical protein